MTLRYLLDTNIISEPLRPSPNINVLNRLAQHENEIGIASVVWHELWYGRHRLPRSRKREAIEVYLNTLVRAMPILAYDEAAAAWHASERARLTAIGRPPPFSDGQIAAIAAVQNLILVTMNLSDYAGFAELRVEDWSAS